MSNTTKVKKNVAIDFSIYYNEETGESLASELIELENKTIDRVTSIFHFINNTKQDAISTVKKIRDIAKVKYIALSRFRLIAFSTSSYGLLCLILAIAHPLNLTIIWKTVLLLP